MAKSYKTGKKSSFSQKKRENERNGGTGRKWSNGSII